MCHEYLPSISTDFSRHYFTLSWPDLLDGELGFIDQYCNRNYNDYNRLWVLLDNL